MNFGITLICLEFLQSPCKISYLPNKCFSTCTVLLQKHYFLLLLYKCLKHLHVLYHKAHKTSILNHIASRNKQTLLTAEEIRCIFDDNSKIILSNLHNQRTNVPVNAHLIAWPSKAQNIQNVENIWQRNDLDDLDHQYSHTFINSISCLHLPTFRSLCNSF